MNQSKTHNFLIRNVSNLNGVGIKTKSLLKNKTQRSDGWLLIKKSLKNIKNPQKAKIILDSCPLNKWTIDQSDWEERFEAIQKGLDNDSKSE